MTCPWGNHIRCYEPGAAFGTMRLGMPYVSLQRPGGDGGGHCGVLPVIPGHAGCARRGRRQGCGTRIGGHRTVARLSRDGSSRNRISTAITFAIYLADFSGPYSRLRDAGLVSEESNQHQYRFLDIVDPETRQPGVPARARSQKHAPPALCAPAGQPQSGHVQHDLRAGS